MNAHAKSTHESAITMIEAEPSKALSARDVFEEFHAALSAEVDAHVPDLSSEKGRKAIASLAFRVTKAKTAIDAAGKKLNEDLRARINVVDAERRHIRDSLDALAERARKPLTDWEAAEDTRLNTVQTTNALIKELAGIRADDTPETVQRRIDEVSNLVLDPTVFRESLIIVEASKNHAIAGLTAHAKRLIKEAEDKAELERLRAEAAERERIERERAAAEERAKAESEAEARRKADEERRIAAAAEEARLKAEREAEQKAQREQEERERAHREELARIERESVAKEQAARAEADRLRREKEAAEAEARARAAEDARRAADIKHRGSIMTAAKEAIMAASGIDEATAKKIVKAIFDGSVPNVSIRF